MPSDARVGNPADMKFVWSRRPRTSPPGPPPPPDDQAYLLLEEARMRCLRLREEATVDERRRQLDVVYRELGMAGYMASSRIPSERRLRLLAEAQERANAGSGGHAGLPRLLPLATAAAEVVERALVAPGITDHVQTASEHVTRARIALGELLAGAPAATPAAHR